MYYADNIDCLKDILDQFEEEEAKAIVKSKKLMRSQTMKANRVFIKANLAFLPHHIANPEEQGMQLTNAMHLMEETRGKLDSIPGKTGEELSSKLDSVLKKTLGFDHIRTIAGVLSGAATTFPEGMGPGDVAMFKYSPTASMDVERSFSMYKNILSDKRHRLTKESLKKIMLCHCYYNRE